MAVQKRINNSKYKNHNIVIHRKRLLKNKFILCSNKLVFFKPKLAFLKSVSARNKVFALRFLSKVYMLNKGILSNKIVRGFIRTFINRIFTKLKYLLQGFNFMSVKKKWLLNKKYILNLKSCLYFYKKYAKPSLVIFSPTNLIPDKIFFLKKPLIKLYNKKLITKNKVKLKKLPFNVISEKNSNNVLFKMLSKFSTYCM